MLTLHELANMSSGLSITFATQYAFVYTRMYVHKGLAWVWRTKMGMDYSAPMCANHPEKLSVQTREAVFAEDEFRCWSRCTDEKSGQ